MDEDDVQTLGWVPLEGRGSLPFALIHGESLVAAASWAVGEAGIELIDAAAGADILLRAGRPLLLHEPLCPLAPADFLLAAARRCEQADRVVVGFRPVTDTVRRRSGDALGATVDRSSLRRVATPVVLPARVLKALPDSPLQVGDLGTLVARLAVSEPIEWLLAPAIAAPARDHAEIGLLEALSRSMTRRAR